MRLLALVSYDGSRFFGSQIQPGGALTVMGCFEKALRGVGIFSTPVAAGRTDAGVHAVSMPIAFDLPPYWEDCEKLKKHLSAKLSPYIQITQISKVKDEFHPRFDAKKRVYRYFLKVGEPSPFDAHLITGAQTLELNLIKEGVRLFEGRHDFSLFKKNGSDEKSTVRLMYKARCYEHKGVVVLSFCANSFLRSQIRLMVGALLDLNDGKITLDNLKEQISNKHRYTSKIAPPNGLYLAKVVY